MLIRKKFMEKRNGEDACTFGMLSVMALCFLLLFLSWTPEMFPSLAALRCYVLRLAQGVWKMARRKPTAGMLLYALPEIRLHLIEMSIVLVIIAFIVAGFWWAGAYIPIATSATLTDIDRFKTV